MNDSENGHAEEVAIIIEESDQLLGEFEIRGEIYKSESKAKSEVNDVAGADGDEPDDESQVIALTDTVGNESTMMIETGYTSVAGGAMF